MLRVLLNNTSSFFDVERYINGIDKKKISRLPMRENNKKESQLPLRLKVGRSNIKTDKNLNGAVPCGNSGQYEPDL
jgi:hypothetical protein